MADSLKSLNLRSPLIAPIFIPVSTFGVNVGKGQGIGNLFSSEDKIDIFGDGFG